MKRTGGTTSGGYLNRDQVVALIEAVSEQYGMAPPWVSFDLPLIWLDKEGNEVEGSNILVGGRYFIAERTIKFPDFVRFEVETVAHEIAHHIDHGRLFMGDHHRHDDVHSDLTAEIRETLQGLIDEEDR